MDDDIERMMPWLNNKAPIKEPRRKPSEYRPIRNFAAYTASCVVGRKGRRRQG